MSHFTVILAKQAPSLSMNDISIYQVAADNSDHAAIEARKVAFDESRGKLLPIEFEVIGILEGKTEVVHFCNRER